MIFEKNMFAGCSKNELETVINAIKKDREEGLLISGYDAMKVQIERIRRYLSVDYEKHPFDQVAAYKIVEKNCTMKLQNGISNIIKGK